MPKRKAMQMPRIPKISQLPSRSWHCSVMMGGKRVSITETDYDECVSKAMMAVSKRLIGSQPPEKRARSLTLKQAVDSYIEARNNVLSPSTVRGYKKIRDLRFQSVIDNPLSSIGNWQSIVNTEAKLCSPKTLKNAWGLVKSVLKENELPLPNVRLPQVIESDHEFLQPDQIKDFLKLIKGEKYELVYLLGLHGLRSSEILGLDAVNNLTNDVIRIRGAKVQSETAKGAVKYVQKQETKTKSSRRDVPVLIPRLKQLRKELEKKDALKDAIPDHPEAARKRLNKICKAEGLPEIGLHGLRHSFASLCYHLGLSEMETMQLGGWHDIFVMRKIYTHLADKDREKAQKKLKDFFK